LFHRRALFLLIRASCGTFQAGWQNAATNLFMETALISNWATTGARRSRRFKFQMPWPVKINEAIALKRAEARAPVK